MVLLAFCVQPLGFLKILSESNGNIWQQVLLIHAVFIYLPVFLILSLFMYFGIVKKQPICSCKDILEAHQQILDRLPNKGKGNEITSCNDPFAKSSWFVRNSIILFCGYCVIGFLASVTLFFFSGSLFTWPVAIPIIGSISESGFSLAIFFQCLCFAAQFFALKQVTFGDRMCMTENENMDRALIAHSN